MLSVSLDSCLRTLPLPDARMQAAELIDRAVRAAVSAGVLPPLEGLSAQILHAQHPAFDLASPAALSAAPRVSISAQRTAEILVSHMPACPPPFEHIEACSGYINFRFQPAWFDALPARFPPLFTAPPLAGRTIRIFGHTDAQSIRPKHYAHALECMLASAGAQACVHPASGQSPDILRVADDSTSSPVMIRVAPLVLRESIPLHMVSPWALYYALLRCPPQRPCRQDSADLLRMDTQASFSLVYYTLARTERLLANRPLHIHSHIPHAPEGEERALLLALAAFPEQYLQAVCALSPARLCTLLESVSTLFRTWYLKAGPAVLPSPAHSRVLQPVHTVLTAGLSALGLPSHLAVKSTSWRPT